MRTYHKLKQKKAILKDTGLVPRNIKSTSRKYKIQPNQMRRWQRDYITQEAAHAVEPDWVEPDRNATVAREEIRSRSKKKTNHNDSNGKLSDTTDTHLLTFVPDLRKQGYVVTVAMVVIEYRRFTPDVADLAFNLLKLQLRRFCITNRIVHHCTTHQGQNHEYIKEVMDDWSTYVNRQIGISGYTAPYIWNMDQTNIYFDIVARTMLEEKGVKVSEHKENRKQ